MNAPTNIQRGKATIFTLNRSQAVRIPKDLAFPDSVKEVHVIRRGKTIEIVPVGSLWDSFFDRPPNPDFPDRDQPPAQDRDFRF